MAKRAPVSGPTENGAEVVFKLYEMSVLSSSVAIRVVTVSFNRTGRETRKTILVLLN